jgi:hypothetical protein
MGRRQGSVGEASRFASSREGKARTLRLHRLAAGPFSVPGRGRQAVFLRRGGSTRMNPDMDASSPQSGSDRLEKQPTDPATAGRRDHYMRDGALDSVKAEGASNGHACERPVHRLNV